MVRVIFFCCPAVDDLASGLNVHSLPNFMQLAPPCIGFESTEMSKYMKSLSQQSPPNIQLTAVAVIKRTCRSDQIFFGGCRERSSGL